jgi:hypothetical protein
MSWVKQYEVFLQSRTQLYLASGGQERSEFLKETVDQIQEQHAIAEGTGSLPENIYTVSNYKS